MHYFWAVWYTTYHDVLPPSLPLRVTTTCRLQTEEKARCLLLIATATASESISKTFFFYVVLSIIIIITCENHNFLSHLESFFLCFCVCVCCLLDSVIIIALKLSLYTCTRTYYCLLRYNYSGTSVSGPSQQRPTSLQRPKRRVQIDFSIDLTHFEPPNNGNSNLQTPASGQRPGSGTLDIRRNLPPRTAKFKPHPLFVQRIHCNIRSLQRPTSLQGPNALVSKWPFFGGSTVY